MKDTNDAEKMKPAIRRIANELHEIEARGVRLERERNEAAEELDLTKSELASVREKHGALVVELQEARASHERTSASCSELIRSKDELSRAFAEKCAELEALEEVKRDGEALEEMAANVTRAEGRARHAEREAERLRTELDAARATDAANQNTAGLTIKNLIRERDETIAEHLRRFEDLRHRADTINQRALALQQNTIAVLPTGRLLQELEKRIPMILVNDAARVGLVLGMIAELERTCALFAKHEATVEALRKAVAERPAGHGLIPDVDHAAETPAEGT